MDDLGIPLTGQEGAQVDDESQYIELLIQATLNEKNSPEILEFEEGLVTSLERSLKEKEEQVEGLESAGTQELERMIYSLEVKRVRYLLKLYYRTRLHKIEKYAAAILDDEAQASKLSQAELQFCQDYFVTVGRHLKEVVLDQLNEDFKPLCKTSALSDTNDLIPRPPMDTHVFAKLVADAGAVKLDDDGGTMVDMAAGDLFIVRYAPVAHLVARRDAVLV
uniref:DNA replication complex GINS protein SLD5 n=1 Tax=Chlamydomonas leiostraca TaxID=1034604 RepID=A0A7S0WZE6_9CHLO|mmetsp:Transcript_4252/g.10611  ORF Transcript_4252/g.10611 Transcript_4252/m.10611 type:complete len:221 (+) Transcript_4252:181-843(+)|eukprot:CAMPEP_0202874144 /NCGR_PEP_ID=MMETSP1391-20130828/24819_1 /ASSEMBLY_ACC=CAM_ASM_000867 /TAXON_ID=1034604 /ORGANISM="Chlamydomonas leiostraca, Strain SAG 11-49" /LENGTH=220 /DNA_ID=CAMNT_0049555521 /DNA_START=165 /DNA_END=827 /DNA_ORIENTATION=+